MGAQANPFGDREREIASLTRIAERTSPIRGGQGGQDDGEDEGGGEYPPLTRFSRMAREYGGLCSKAVALEQFNYTKSPISRKT